MIKNFIATVSEFIMIFGCVCLGEVPRLFQGR